MDGLDTDALFGAFDESVAASRPKPGSSKRPAPAPVPAPVQVKRAKPEVVCADLRTHTCQ